MSANAMRPSSLTAREQAALRPIERATISPAGRIEFRIQRPLKNANGPNRNPHWSKKHAGRQAWQASLCNALVLSIGYPAACALLVEESGLAGASALKRLQAVGELVGEGQTQARIYRLVQCTSAPHTPARPTIRYRGEEFERVWPIPGDPKASTSALADPEAAR